MSRASQSNLKSTFNFLRSIMKDQSRLEPGKLCFLAVVYAINQNSKSKSRAAGLQNRHLVTNRCNLNVLKHITSTKNQ